MGDCHGPALTAPTHPSSAPGDGSKVLNWFPFQNPPPSGFCRRVCRDPIVEWGRAARRSWSRVAVRPRRSVAASLREADALEPQQLNRWLDRMSRLMSVPHLAPHQLRHRRATNLLRAGAPLPDRKQPVEPIECAYHDAVHERWRRQTRRAVHKRNSAADEGTPSSRRPRDCSVFGL